MVRRSRRQGKRERATERGRMKTTRTTRRGSCSDKRLFRNQEEAEKAVHKYTQRIVFSDMNAYRCRRNQGWHIGHRNKRREGREKMRILVLWFDDLEAKCATVRCRDRRPLQVSRQPERTPFSKCRKSEEGPDGRD